MTSLQVRLLYYLTNIAQFIPDKGVFRYLRDNSLYFLHTLPLMEGNKTVNELYLLWTLGCNCEHPALPRVRCLMQDSKKTDKQLAVSCKIK